MKLRANDTVSIQQLKVLDDIFENIRNVYGDSIKFSAFETSVRNYSVLMGKEYEDSVASMPITEVSFGRTCQFIIKLNELINSDEADIEFSLPTKDEWEYAAWGGEAEGATIYAGSNDIDEVAWYEGNSKMRPHPADGQNQLHPNGFGLYDMSGNVFEYTFTPYIDFNAPGRATNMMLIKGGSYASEAEECSVSYEAPMETDLSSPKVGFRLVLRKK